MTGKVYVLMGGDRYDRHLRAVFSTREAAEAALRFGDEQSTVEEFAVDAPLPEAPADHCLWRVQLEFAFNDLSAFRVEVFDTERIGEVSEDDNFCWVPVWALDEEHALQAGSEQISQFMALKKLLG